MVPIDENGKNMFFREAIRVLFSHDKIQIAMQDLLNYLKGVMPADRMHLNYFDQELKALRVLVVVTPQEALRSRLIFPLDEAGVDYLRDPMTNETQIINRIGDDPVDRWIVQKSGLFTNQSGMYLLLKREGEARGSLVVVADGVGRFSQHHLDRFTMLKEPFEVLLEHILRDEELIQIRAVMNRDALGKLNNRAGNEIVGSNFGLRRVMDMVAEVAPMNCPVLLLGETGVGKEVIARGIHKLSPRAQQPFVPVNSGAIPEGLIDSELFGHERGAFTGATSRKEGYFQLAEGGTIFLDEIGELPPPAQVRLLRVLQDKTIQLVGGKSTIQVDARVIAATHRNLEEMIQEGLFRSDLWFRLNVFPIIIPPLRDRKEDIPALLTNFIEEKRLAMNLSATPRLAPGTLELLIGYDWPGNVRELENMVERAMILSKDGLLSFTQLIPMDDRSGLYETSARAQVYPSLNDHTAEYIRRVLKGTKGKIEGPGGAAEILKINPGTLRHRMKKLGISYRKKEMMG